MTASKDTTALADRPWPQMASDAVHEAAPALGWYTDAILFHENWADPRLARRDRSILTVSVLITRGYWPQLVSHLKRALANGVTAAELVEIATHLTFYGGWPCGMSAVATIRDVFADQGIGWDQVAGQMKDDLPSCAPHEGEPSDLARSLGFSPTLAAFTDRVILDDLWQRATLAPRDRSLATIAALVAGGDTGQIAFHVQRGLDNGLTETEIAEAMTHLAFYAGWPKAISAVRAIEGARTRG